MVVGTGHANTSTRAIRLQVPGSATPATPRPPAHSTEDTPMPPEAGQPAKPHGAGPRPCPQEPGGRAHGWAGCAVHRHSLWGKRRPKAGASHGAP